MYLDMNSSMEILEYYPIVLHEKIQLYTWRNASKPNIITQGIAGWTRKNNLQESAAVLYYVSDL